jgi:hypothetical protein
MKPTRTSAAIATLVRWREFQEAQSRVDLMSLACDTMAARECSDQSQTSVDDVRSQLGELFAQSRLDLSLLQHGAQIEDAAWQNLQAARMALSQASEREAIAQASHLQARAKTRVADSRRQRITAEELDREEKTAFDRMAELYRPASGRL